MTIRRDEYGYTENETDGSIQAQTMRRDSDETGVSRRNGLLHLRGVLRILNGGKCD